MKNQNSRCAICLILSVISGCGLTIAIGAAVAKDPVKGDDGRHTAAELRLSFMKAQWEQLLSKAKPKTNPPHDALKQQATDVAMWLLQSKELDAQQLPDPICIQIIVSGDFIVDDDPRVLDLKVIKNEQGNDEAIVVWYLVPLKNVPVRIKVLGTFVTSVAGRADRQVMHACREFTLEGNEWKAASPLTGDYADRK